MKIKTLKSAREDLKEGFYFYDSQQIGLGAYFLESLSSDIEYYYGFVVVIMKKSIGKSIRSLRNLIFPEEKSAFSFSPACYSIIGSMNN